MRSLAFLLISLCLLHTASIAANKPNLSLREEIGQMLLLGFDGKELTADAPIAQAIEHDNIGGVILFDYDSQKKIYDKNIASPAQVKKLNHDLQQLTTQANKAHHRTNLPLLISVDYEGGRVNRLGEQYGFNATKTAAEIGRGNFVEAESSAKAMANTLNEAGFNLNFAPLVDVNVNPDNPVIGKNERSFSSDATRVAQFSHIYSHQYLKQKIQCVYKHFPGHGSSTKDSHLDFVDVSDTWQQHEMEPYQQLLNSVDSCGMVMSAHIVNRQLDESGLPATLSHKILTELLRHQLHFNGVIITDDLQMKAISDHYGLEQALVLSINAGADMLIFGNNLSVAPQSAEQLIDIIEAQVLAGKISRHRIHEAYQRIKQLKQSLANS